MIGAAVMLGGMTAAVCGKKDIGKGNWGIFTIFIIYN